ncbi:YegS/Rv2252/BmrU family lipid kinase [Gillisia mitskevichiae]|uniref:YegS/Rv2252/BmrU family lipid kinase n=1 Tax=Gillisia mitskevichiae TaxID=270921 RepID=A0A495PV45_9FLAO|nr:diacylglycerol kinase family protein [Gillisia mitskevichiae]RKS53338.1 YegS/Rv2252/BmrU family lipid kinase [Gillisia mitskevichiae]
MEPKNKILLVVNPISGNFDKANLINTVKTKLANKNILVEVYETKGHEDIKAISKLINQHQPERLLVAGGDGTIQLVAKVLKDFDLSLGILPAGSANGFAINLNLPDNLNDQIEVATGETTFTIDTLELNGEMCLHISDLGINAELIRLYEHSNIRGKFGYFLQSFPTLFKSNYPYKFTIEAKGHKYVKKGVLLAIANANKFGTGANINPNGKLDDGKFEILIFKRLSIFQILKTLIKNSQLNSNFVEAISVEEATITCKNPVAFQIDGEFIGKRKKVVVKVSDQKLRVAVSKNFNPALNRNNNSEKI